MQKWHTKASFVVDKTVVFTPSTVYFFSIYMMETSRLHATRKKINTG